MKVLFIYSDKKRKMFAKTNKKEPVYSQDEMQYPGTELYKYCVDNKLIKGSCEDNGRDVAVLDLPGFPRKQIRKQYYDFFSNVYAKSKLEKFAFKAHSYILFKWKLYPIARFAVSAYSFITTKFKRVDVVANSVENV